MKNIQSEGQAVMLNEWKQQERGEDLRKCPTKRGRGINLGLCSPKQIQKWQTISLISLDLNSLHSTTCFITCKHAQMINIQQQSFSCVPISLVLT